MSDKVVKLTIAPEPEIPSDREQVLARFDELAKGMREWLEQSEGGGFALFGYSRSTDDQGESNLHTWCNCYVHDAGDAFWLPDGVKTRVYNRLHDDK